MINPFYFDDDYSFGSPPEEDDTLSGRLRRFHELFDSSIRAILRDCLFRVEEDYTKGIATLQILCPNQAVLKRLSKKRDRICNNVNSIWGRSIQQVGLCINENGSVSQQVTLQCRYPLY
ncbi:MAG: hypothetical protein N3E45_14120 [Oscillatoriaceae bacterium SKW80]|nr:hypothetical protein [Oscillatoriaceae bacterium SKYG93]MCX8121936.1 hypothetical protein [Oscillatoriaceae bacterium SKW80]MDW8454222.1 hypothetical protein [Oscillatoriaceae cyanobacterium SKYGB_i_bin93]HIK29086.1 hypothetical protein [Oscillatoriaceae cyanobacterium M7585_C2015_266]